MKVLFLLPILATAFLASSCRTVVPIDPMTMKQDCKCLPEHFKAHGCQCGKVIAEK